MKLNKVSDILDLKYFVVAVCLLLVGCNKHIEQSNSVSFHTLSANQKTTNDFSFLFDHISDLQKENVLVGAEVLIIRNDTIQLHDVVGWSDRENNLKLQKNSLYRIRSMTKPIIATAILILLEEGKLDLEDPVYKYIPSFDNPKADYITIKQCLTHTSGLGNHDWQDIGLSKPATEFETLSELVNEIGINGMFTEPNKHRYSDSGYAVLTEIIALISGMPAEDFIKSRIFEPLEMSNTFTHFDPNVNWASQLNPTYRWNDSINDFEQYWNPQMQQEYKFFRGHGGVYTSAMDYAKFLKMWLNHGKFNNNQILSEKTINYALTETILQPLGAPQSHQGLAWMMMKPDSLSSETDYLMHGGSDGTMAFAYPNENTIALYFTQSRNHPRFIFENLMAITEPYSSYRKWNYNNTFLDQWKEVLIRDKDKANQVNVLNAESYLGKYNCITNSGFDSEIILKKGQLILKNVNSGYEIKLYYYQENEFICRFRPPLDGFISKIIFRGAENDFDSFSLEWLNKTKFEFEKIK
jgi:CubicO group peptidase (beta-lactamase class C family)